MNSHLQKAKDYITKGDDYYAKAADEIVAAQEADPQLSYRDIAVQLGRDESWVRRLVRARTNAERAPDEPLVVDWHSGSNERTEVTRKTLAKAEPNTIREIVRELPREQRERLIDASHDATINEIRAERAEHNVEPTTGELMGGERWDPSESWADTLLIRTNRNLRELGAHIQKWGFVLGSMSIEDAYEYINETERIAADVRAQVQEQLRDRVGI